jgi:hypothetical protein
MSFVTDLLKKDTDTIVKTIILLFAPSKIGAAQPMVYPSISPKSVSYTPNLTKEDYDKVLDEIDDLLDDFVKEGGTANKMGEVVAAMIYTPTNVNAIVKGIYGMFDENGIVDMLRLMGIDASPKGVASMLTEKTLSGTAKVL